MWLLFEFYLSTDIDNIIGSYETVQRFLKKVRKDILNKASQELIWDPG